MEARCVRTFFHHPKMKDSKALTKGNTFIENNRRGAQAANK
jgi:hypothetical protein